MTEVEMSSFNNLKMDGVGEPGETLTEQVERIEREMERERTNDASESSAPQEECPEGETPPNVIFHKLEHDDTLHGLALRYGTSQAAIKQLNSLLSGDLDLLPSTTVLQIPTGGKDIKHYDKLKSVPLSEEDKKERKLRKFMDDHKCSRQEAHFYLTSNDWDWDLAMSECMADKKWESENPSPKVKVHRDRKAEIAKFVEGLCCTSVGPPPNHAQNQQPIN
eukprot:TRINITY_DN3161_c0_g1_i1.p1 TRINITY_DN3161_c0_g1~~TRINITY_DN3161_c0_g1_i1.p1  ORF type:complete len:221 (+),score=38.15 TRINITY_DN3161_c0_g1_i1:60-722(+)